MGKSERVEGQESLHTVGGPAGYLCSATLQSRYCKCTLWARRRNYES